MLQRNFDNKNSNLLNENEITKYSFTSIDPIPLKILCFCSKIIRFLTLENTEDEAYIKNIFIHIDYQFKYFEPGSIDENPYEIRINDNIKGKVAMGSICFEKI